MDLIDQVHKLQYFRHVVEAGSIKLGSERAFLSQPHMSKVIQQLEDACSTRLLIRSKTGVEPTKAGSDLYQLSVNLSQQVNQFLQSIHVESKPREGLVRIGTYDSIARYFIPYFLDYFEFRNPKFQLQIKTSRSSEIAHDIQNDELDLGIIVDAINYADLEHTCAYMDSFGLYTSNLAKNRNRDRLIYFDYSKNEVKQSIKKFNFHDFSHCDNIETVKSLCEKGLGVGLIPHRVARDGVLSGKLVPYRHPKIKSNFFDEHSIDLCNRQENTTADILYVKDEILRFLQIWSKK